MRIELSFDTRGWARSPMENLEDFSSFLQKHKAICEGMSPTGRDITISISDELVYDFKSALAREWQAEDKTEDKTMNEAHLKQELARVRKKNEELTIKLRRAKEVSREDEYVELEKKYNSLYEEFEQAKLENRELRITILTILKLQG